MNPLDIDEPEALMRQLRRAGWSIGEVGAGTHWVVTGTNGENAIHAESPDPLTAWRRAVEQAVSLGMFGRG